MLNLSQLLPPLPDRTDVITFSIKVNGTLIPDNFEVSSIVVNRCFNRIPYALLQVLDSDVSAQRMEVSDQDIFSPGNEIEISAGYYRDEAVIFKGIIIRHALKIRAGQSPMLEIECKDKAVRMTVERKNAYFLESSDQEIIESILNNHGLTPEVESTSVTHPEMVQYHATDWDFILTRAEANALLVLAKDNTIIAKKPDFEADAKMVLTYGSSIFEFEAEMDARDQYPAAKAVTWDYTNQALTEVQADANGVSALGGLGGAIAGAVGAVAGAAQSALGAVGVSLPGVPPNTDYTQSLGVSHVLLQHSGKLPQPELEKWVEAQFQKSKLAKLRGRVKFEGLADIYPGDSIELQNVGLRHAGKVLITAIRHEIKDGSWFAQAQFGLPQEWFVEEFPNVNYPIAGSLLPAIQGLQVGVVTRLAGDPDGEDRIQVRLPLVAADGEGVWVRIAAMDAGDNRGAFFRPEIEDEVIVAFINNDPRQGVVLGMLNSKAKPAPLPTTDDNHEKGWVTRSGIKLIFNDEKSSYTLETPGGNKCVIDDDDKSILLEDQHGNSLKMNQDGITINSAKDIILSATGDVKIEGTNLENKANAEFKAEGMSKASLKSTADVVVQGTFVKIN
ncbi:MAG TPA: type VI secretion system tip protein VgrG [Saprospiraceae bacterium]|nr:type VI secretion system tip protein VgrG [Saprospiraceae bacterium]HMQ82146.1 type VI secretion system tip protein VgrG [Saprospiraceae bacterium]